MQEREEEKDVECWGEGKLKEVPTPLPVFLEHK